MPGGLLLLREAERRLSICGRLADAMPDRRDQARIRHEMVELVTARAFAIFCGYKDSNDLDRLRHDPLLKLAVGRAPADRDHRQRARLAPVRRAARRGACQVAERPRPWLRLRQVQKPRRLLRGGSRVES